MWSTNQADMQPVSWAGSNHRGSQAICTRLSQMHRQDTLAWYHFQCDAGDNLHRTANSEL